MTSPVQKVRSERLAYIVMTIVGCVTGTIFAYLGMLCISERMWGYSLLMAAFLCLAGYLLFSGIRGLEKGSKNDRT